MSVKTVGPTETELSGLVNDASQEPVILRTQQAGDFAVLPLDDEVLDLLLERSPKLGEECGRIREQMAEGGYLTHEQVIDALMGQGSQEGRRNA